MSTVPATEPPPPPPPLPARPKRPIGWILAVVAAFVVGAAVGSSASGSDNDAASADGESLAISASVGAANPTASPIASSTPSPPPVAANPDAKYTSQCDYLLGNFNDLDPNGYRFVAGARITNTGNVGVVVELRAKWDQLGTSPITKTRQTRIDVGKSKPVNITVLATGDQIDLHQSADGHCSAKVALVDTYGSPEP
jgi:hypothetical protein